MWEVKTCALCANRAPPSVSLGPLLGPLADGKGGQGLYVHRLCALWSPEVYQTEAGTLRNVLAAVRRGRQVHCRRCGRRGATIGCLLERCPCSYHLACAQEAGATFHCSDYTLACPDHAHLYPQKPGDAGATPFAPAPGGGGPGQPSPAKVHPTPGGGTPAGAFSPPTALPLPKQPGRKRGRHGAMEIYDHMMAARAAIKRARREIRAARRVEEESSDDEEHFAKKEAARLARDKARLNAITLGGSGPGAGAGGGFGRGGGRGGGGATAGGEPQGDGGVGMLGGPPLPGAGGAPPQPVPAGVVAGTDFSSVAGLDSVVSQLREMVLLPLIYPDLFARMGITPPRGILFHGEPGTGKTLAARALAGACAKHSPAPVTFFARKGADCLGKFSGEAERTLRLLFEEASARAPAIVFLDELDALVPARAARAGGSDQIYASVVSTLLSLLDGISDRGNVIVIGATNRPEAIDPALRRPGRFDREVYFGLPGPEQRAAILKVHTRKWPRRPPAELLQQVAGLAEGYAGADLQALCTAAVMSAVRRAAPALIELAERPAATGEVGPPAVAGDEGAPGAAGPVAAGATAAPTAAGTAAAAGPDRATLERLLESVHVEPRDWWEALAAAPAPCSRRHGLSALSAGAARPLAPHLLPLLAPPIRAALRAIHSSALPLPPAAGAAAVAAAAAAAEDASGPQDSSAGPNTASSSAFRAVLSQLGAALPSGPADSSQAGFGRPAAALLQAAPGPTPGGVRAKPAAAPELPGRHSGSSGCWVPCRVLLAGEGERGQEQAAGALLKLLEGCPVHTVSLPTAVVEGGGDATAGCVSVVGEALRRASPHLPCVFYLPRLEAWALHQTLVPAEEFEGGGAGGQGLGEGAKTPGRGAPSPAFGSHGTPGSRRFPTAPSPFSGLLPLEERVPNTPSAAHALRAEADTHRPSAAGSSAGGQHTEGSLAHPQGHPKQPQPSHPSAQQHQHLAFRPASAASTAAAMAATAAAVLLPSAAGAAGVLAGAAGDVGPQLPRIRTSLSPDGTKGAGPQQQQLPRPVSPAQPPSPAGEVEVTRLAEAWNVFESLMKQVPPSQPVIVLATCHAPLDSLPPLLLSFFGAGAAPTGPAREARQQGEEQVEPAGGGGLVVLRPPGEGEWEQSLACAGEGLAERVAGHAAAALRGKLLAQREGSMAAAAAAHASAASPTRVSPQPGPTEVVTMPAGEAAGAGAAPLPPAGPAGAAVAAAAAVAPPPELSRAELQQGLQLLGKVAAFLRSLGGHLAGDARSKLASAWVKGGRDGTSGGHGGRSRGEKEPAQLVSFGDVARRAKRGGYATLEELEAEATATVKLITGAAQGDGGPDPATAAACALLDEVEERCHWARQQLGLGQPEVARLAEAAARHVAAMQRALRAREEAERRQEQQQAQQAQQEAQHEQQQPQPAAPEADGQPEEDHPAAPAGAQALEGAVEGKQAEAEGPGAPTSGAPAASGLPALTALQPEQPLDAAPAGASEAAEAAAGCLRVALCDALREVAAAALQQRARRGPSAVLSLDAAVSAALAAGCSACGAAIDGAELLGLEPSEPALRELASHCAAGVLAALAAC